MKRNEQKLETSPAYHLYITYQIDPDTSSKRVELSHFAGFGNSVCVLRVRTIPILLVCSGSIQFYPILANRFFWILLCFDSFWFLCILCTMYGGHGHLGHGHAGQRPGVAPGWVPGAGAAGAAGASALLSTWCTDIFGVQWLQYNDNIYIWHIYVYIYYYNIITMFILMILMFHNVLQFYIDSTVLQICSTMLYSNESTNQNNLMAMTRDLAFECFWCRDGECEDPWFVWRALLEHYSIVAPFGWLLGTLNISQLIQDEPLSCCPLPWRISSP